LSTGGAATPVERCHRFWFRQIPPHVYAVLRIAFGVLCLLDLLGATPISMFWDLNGIAPLPGGGTWGFRSWVVASGFAPVAAWVVFTGTLLAYLCMTLGIGGQAAVFASLLANVWQTAWNVLPLSASHQALTAVLFSLVWADCGQVLTVSPTRNAALPPQPQSIAPLRVLQYQVCLIYFSSGVSKFSNELWRDGSAIYYAMSHNVVQRFPVDVLPLPMQGVATLTTYGTLAFELAFPLLVAWRRTRILTLIAGVGLHLGAWVTLEVGPFSWVMIATYIAFLPPERLATLVDEVWQRKAARYRPSTPSQGL
jgi:hypothetical protein